jgi:hypothetical protein
MKIEKAFEYFGAIESRERLLNMLKQGRREFSGYGLELFEKGILNKLQNVELAISEYETRLGYTTLAPRSFWYDHLRAEMITEGTLVFANPSVSLSSAVYTANTPSLQMSMGPYPLRNQMCLFTQVTNESPREQSFFVGTPPAQLALTA